MSECASGNWCSFIVLPHCSILPQTHDFTLTLTIQTPVQPVLAVLPMGESPRNPQFWKSTFSNTENDHFPILYIGWKSAQYWIQYKTLKAPRKTASENVVCLCRLLNILANFSKLFFAYQQTVWTQIRLLLTEQSDWVHTVCRNDF